MTRWGDVALIRHEGRVYSLQPTWPIGAPPTTPGQECIRALVFTGVDVSRGFTLSKLNKLLAKLQRDWIGRTHQEWIDAMTQETIDVRLDRVVHDEQGYWLATDSGEKLHGPYESKAYARNMAWIRPLMEETGQALPRPTCRYRHYNGMEYTVLGVSNLNSDRSEYEAHVFYQGDNGRTWDKTLPEFMRKMKLVASNDPVLSITDEGPAQIMFVDLQGQVCVARETAIEDRLSFGPETTFGDLATGAKVRSEMVMGRGAAGALAIYLSYFAQYGRLPDKSLSSDITQ